MMKLIPIQFLLSFLFFSVAFVGCTKKIYQEIPDEDGFMYNEPGSKNAPYVDEAESPQVRGGDHRVELSWDVLDSRAKSYKVVWEKGEKSEKGDISEAGLITTLIDDLAEGMHGFSIYLYDEEGNSSKKKEVYGNAYGSAYEEGLSNRGIQSIKWMGEGDADAEITWAKSNTLLKDMEVTYTDDEGNEIKRTLLPKEKDVLEKISDQGAFSFKTGYWPEEEALDAFYAADTVIQIEDFIGTPTDPDPTDPDPTDPDPEEPEHPANPYMLTFNVRHQSGAQNQTPRLFVSSDFNGEMNEEAVNSPDAKWQDITELVDMAGGDITNTSDYLSVGSADISPFIEANKDFYIAVRYDTEPFPEDNTDVRPRNWDIQNLSITEDGGDFGYEYDKNDGTFVLEGLYLDNAGRVQFAGSSIKFQYPKSGEFQTMTGRVWAILKVTL